MNESAEYTRLLAQAYSKLADDYVAMWKREDAARAEIQRLEELLEKWMAEANKQSERADAADAYVRALEEVCDSQQLKCAQSSARQQGGAK